MKLIKPVVFGMLLAVGLSATAQEDHMTKTPAEKAAKYSSKLAETYNLSEEQTATVEAAQLDFFTSASKIKQDESITREVKGAQITSAKAGMNASIKSVLTEEQYLEYSTDSTKRATAQKQKVKENRTPEAMAKHKAEKLAAKLSDVTDAQQMQMEALFLKVAKKIEAVKANESLSKEQKIEYTKGNRADGKTALRTILTEAQQAELDVLKAKRIETKDIEDDNK
ncbi:MAG: hypothetical protein ACI865_002916 [Flavobacteriaceae bacterium]|jgi:hypothetical protein